MTERESQPEERPQEEKSQPPAPPQRLDESIKQAQDTVQPDTGMQGPPDGNPPPPPPPPPPDDESSTAD